MSRRTQTADAPPHDLEAEKWVLGSILFGGADTLAEVTELVGLGDFYQDRHKQIFAALQRLAESDKPLNDVALLSEELEARGELESVGGPPYLLEILQAVPHAEHAPHYAASVRDKSERRRAIEAAREVERLARDLAADPGDALALLTGLGDSIDRPSPVRLIGSREFDDADYEVEFLIDNLLVRGQPMIGGGPAKGCKTIVTASIIVCGAAGKPILNCEKFTVLKPFRSAFISMESGGAALRVVARSQCHSIGCRLSDLEGQVFWQLDSLKLSDPATLTALRREIERREIDFLCIDPLYLALDLEADDSTSIFKMGRRLVEIGKLCTDTGCTVELNHHGIKRPQEPNRPMKLVDLSGAGVTEFARQWKLLSRRTEYDEERPGHHELWLRVGGSAFPGSLLALDIDEFSDAGFRREWRVATRPASEAQSDQRQQERNRQAADREATKIAADKAAVDRYAPKAVAFLRRALHRAGASESAIRNGAGCSPKNWPAVVAHLIESGEVVECFYKATNGHEYAGYRLAEIDSDSLGSSDQSESNPSRPDSATTHTDYPPLGKGNPSGSVSPRRKRASGLSTTANPNPSRSKRKAK